MDYYVDMVRRFVCFNDRESCAGVYAPNRVIHAKEVGGLMPDQR